MHVAGTVLAVQHSGETGDAVVVVPSDLKTISCGRTAGMLQACCMARGRIAGMLAARHVAAPC